MRLIVLFLFLVGCGDDAPRGLRISKIEGFSTMESTKITEGVDLLHQGAGSSFLTSGTRQVVIKKQTLPGTDMGRAVPRVYSCEILIDTSNQTIQTDLNNLKYILAHQLGHCSGMGYSSDINSVMYPTYSGNYDANTEQKILDFSKVLLEKTN